MPIGSTYSLAVDQQLHINAISNIFNYRQTGGASDDDEQALMNAFFADVMTTWQDLVTDQWSAVCMRAREVSADGTRPEVLQLLTGISGSITNEEALPTNVVACISFYSETYDRTGRGRNYFSGSPVSAENENTWDNPHLVKLDALGTALINNITDGATSTTFERVIWGGEPVATAKPVIKHEGNPEVRKLRRRTRTLCTDT